MTQAPPPIWVPPRRPLLVPSRRLVVPTARPALRWRSPIDAINTRGAKLLGTGGKRRLRPGGKRTVKTDAGASCCCCSTGKRCFQEWFASYACATNSWSGPLSDNRLCLDERTNTSWQKAGADGTGCLYHIYVPYQPAHCCGANSDCPSDLGNTATPALPFGGGAPTDCCICTPACVSNPILRCCQGPPYNAAPFEESLTPDAYEVTVLSVENTGVTEVDGDGRSWVMDGAGVAGVSLRLNRIGDSCSYISAMLDVTGLAKILFTDVGGGAAVNIVDSVFLQSVMSAGSFPTFLFYTADGRQEAGDCTTPPLCAPPDGDVRLSIVCELASSTFVACCKAYTVNYVRYADVPPGSVDWDTVFFTKAGVAPCP